MVAFSGYLAHMRKDDLKTLAEDLGLPHNGSRADLENIVRQKLQSDDQLYQSKRYSGVTGVNVVKRTNGTSSEAPHSNRSSSSSFTASPAKALRTASPAKAQQQVQRLVTSASAADIGDAAQSITDTVKSTIQDGVENLPATFHHAGQELVHVAENQLELVKHLDRNQLLHAISRWSQGAERQLGRGARKAQSTLSDGWTVVIVTLLAELLFVFAASVPNTKQVKVGPLEWMLRPLTPDSAYTLTLPDLIVLRQYGVLRPILLWLATSVVLPLIGAHLVVFPKPHDSQQQRRSSRLQTTSNYLMGLNPPSALSFSILRLAFDFYLNKMTATPAISFTYDIVQRFGSLQILAASVALAFTTYELLASH